MTNDIPQHFDETFLRWFQIQAVEAWQRYRTISFEEFVASQGGRNDWKQGTRWFSGLSEQEIATIEQDYQVRFPPDYRLFLQMLHPVDLPPYDGKIWIPRFPNWKDPEAIQAAYEWLVHGLVFDVQQTDMWLQSWGTKPDTTQAQEIRVRELVQAAPRLLPVIGHRYLLAEPCEAGNPVLSIHQSDIIVYGIDLHDYFLHEFTWLGFPQPVDYGRITEEQHEAYLTIPFWGELLSYNEGIS
jgi:hypothetical protein